MPDCVGAGRKTTLRVDFQLIACAAGAQEDSSEPSCESPRPKEASFGILRTWDSAFGPRTDSGFYAADRLEVTELGADLSKTYVHYKQRWTLPFR